MLIFADMYRALAHPLHVWIDLPAMPTAHTLYTVHTSMFHMLGARSDPQQSHSRNCTVVLAPFPPRSACVHR
jgi:hypothetical protein